MEILIFNAVAQALDNLSVSVLLFTINQLHIFQTFWGRGLLRLLFVLMAVIVVKYHHVNGHQPDR